MGTKLTISAPNVNALEDKITPKIYAEDLSVYFQLRTTFPDWPVCITWKPFPNSV